MAFFDETAGGIVGQRGAASEATSPLIRYGALFCDVQMRGLFQDGKTFADAIAKTSPESILADYLAQIPKADDDLAIFIRRHFDLPV